MSIEISDWKISNCLKNNESNFNKKKIFILIKEKEIDEAYKDISKW